MVSHQPDTGKAEIYGGGREQGREEQGCQCQPQRTRPQRPGACSEEGYAALLLKKPMAATATVDPLQCRPVFIPQMLTFPWASLLSLSLLPFSPTSPEPGSAQAAGAFLCGCMSARRQPRHWWLFPTAVCAFRSRSSSCVSAQCRPDTCYWVYSHVHAYGKILQP